MQKDRRDIIAIVPARAGSKRLKNKNRLAIGGKSLLSRTFEIIDELNLIENTIFTSDDHVLLEEAQKFGVDSPGLRPSHLSSDNSKSIDVVEYVLDWAKHSRSWKPKTILYLQLTSPFRQSSQIQNGFNLMMEDDSINAVVSGIVVEELSSKTIGLARDLLPKKQCISPESIIEADGNFYIVKVENLLNEKSFFPNGCRVLLSDEAASIDIDTYEDLQRAQEICR